MKKLYEEPEIDIVRFFLGDILCTSQDRENAYEDGDDYDDIMPDIDDDDMFGFA